jgi:hypothetical protein
VSSSQTTLRKKTICKKCIRFSVSSKNPRLKVLQIVLTKDEVQRSEEEEEENISSLLHFFPSSSCS